MLSCAGEDSSWGKKLAASDLWYVRELPPAPLKLTTTRIAPADSGPTMTLRFMQGDDRDVQLKIPKAFDQVTVVQLKRTGTMLFVGSGDDRFNIGLHPSSFMRELYKISFHIMDDIVGETAEQIGLRCIKRLLGLTDEELFRLGLAQTRKSLSEAATDVDAAVAFVGINFVRTVSLCYDKPSFSVAEVGKNRAYIERGGKALPVVIYVFSQKGDYLGDLRMLKEQALRVALAIAASIEDVK